MQNFLLLRVLCLLSVYLGLPSDVSANSCSDELSKKELSAREVDPFLVGAEGALEDFYNDPLFFPKKRILLDYIDLSRLEPVMGKVLEPQKFLEDMLARGEIGEITGDYARDSSLLCENSVAWALLKMREYPEIYARMKVAYGSFYSPGLPIRMEHYWLVLTTREGQDYYVDLTLKQFIREAPELAVMKAHSDETTYEVWGIVSPKEYIEDLYERSQPWASGEI